MVALLSKYSTSASHSYRETYICPLYCTNCTVLYCTCSCVVSCCNNCFRSHSCFFVFLFIDGSDPKDALREKVLAMGGSFDVNLTLATTHLVVASASTEKYKVATTMKVKSLLLLYVYSITSPVLFLRPGRTDMAEVSEFVDHEKAPALYGVHYLDCAVTNLFVLVGRGGPTRRRL